MFDKNQAQKKTNRNTGRSGPLRKLESGCCWSEVERQFFFVFYLFSSINRLNLMKAGDAAKNIHLWTTDSAKFSLFTATETSPVLLAFFPCAFTKHENKVSTISSICQRSDRDWQHDFRCSMVWAISSPNSTKIWTCASSASAPIRIGHWRLIKTRKRSNSKWPRISTRTQRRPMEFWWTNFPPTVTMAWRKRRVFSSRWISKFVDEASCGERLTFNDDHLFSERRTKISSSIWRSSMIRMRNSMLKKSPVWFWRNGGRKQLESVARADSVGWSESMLIAMHLEKGSRPRSI